MDNPIKKKSLIPRMFRAFTVYFFITLAVFFGYVELFGGVKTIRGTLPDSAQGETDMSFSNFVTNMMSLQNIYAEGVELKFEGGGTTICMRANVAMDLATNGISVDAKLDVDGHVYDASVVYCEPEVFVSLDGTTYKFATASLGGDIDFSSVLKLLSNAAKVLNVDLGGINKIQEALGVDFSNFDMASLLDQLDISTKKSNGEVKISIIVMNFVEALITCDENCFMKSAQIDGINIGANKLSVAVPIVEMNNINIIDKIQTPDEKDVVDMSGVNDYALYTQNLFENDFVSADVRLQALGQTLDARLLVDKSEKIKVGIETEVEGFAISTIYENEKVFVKVDDFGLVFDMAEFESWKEKIATIIESKTSKTVSEIVSELVEKYLGEDMKNLDLQKLLTGALGNGLSSSQSMAALLPKETNLTENQFVLSWENGFVLTLVQEEKALSAIKVTCKDFALSADFVILNEGLEVIGDFFDVSALLPLVDVVDAISTTGKFGGKILTKADGQSIELDYAVSLTNGVVARFDTTVLGEEISVFVTEEKLFAQIGSVVVEGAFDDLDKMIARINEIFGLDLSTNAEMPMFEMASIAAMIKEILPVLKIENRQDLVAEISYLSHTVDIAAEDGVATITYSYGDIVVTMTLAATDAEVEVPVATDEIFGLLAKLENVKSYVSGKQFAFDVAFVYEGLNISANVRIDLESCVFAIENLAYKNIRMNAYYKDKVLYADVNGKKFKVKIKSVEDLANVVMPILQSNGVNFSVGTKVDVAEISNKVFGEDLTKMSIEQLCQRISLALDGCLDDLSLTANFDFANDFGFALNIGFDDNNLKSCQFSDKNMLGTIEFVGFSEIIVAEEDYYDLTAAQKGRLTISVADQEVAVDIELNLNGRLYARASTELFGLEAQVLVCDNMLYVTLGQMSFEADFNSAKDLFDKIVDLFEISLGGHKQVDVRGTLGGLDLSKVDFVTERDKIELSYADAKISAQLILNNDVEFEMVKAPNSSEDLESLLPKIKNVLDYVSAGVFEFDFDANYNGFSFVGKFKYADGVFEISDVLAAGELANIRIEDGYVYFSYGNMKLKFVVPQNDGSVESAQFKKTISKLLADEFGVDVNFGVFEEILDMIANYSTEDWKTRVVAALTGNSNDINLSISNKKQLSLSEILTANIVFDGDKLDSAKVSIYDILSAEIKVKHVPSSTIKPFVAEDYADYCDDFLAGALDSLEVVPNVYGFSSDIAIRYSKTTFYGEVVAMMVKDEEVGDFVPAVGLHTTSLGLNSFIYVVGNTLYIDINGLQIAADLSMTTIDEVLGFVESKFGIALSGQGDALTQGMSALSIILPAIDKIYASWLSETDNGIQVRFDDALWYGEKSNFSDIIAQAFVTNYNNIIVPTKLVIGANIHDPNTLVYDDYSDAWLSAGEDENGNKIILEDSITQNLNFGAYFTNLSVGVFAENLDRVFAIEGRNYQNITSVVSNYGVSKLEEFNSLETVLSLAETVYDWGMSMHYQISLDGTVESEKSSMKLGGDVVVAVDDLKEGEASQLDLFSGKSLRVQGNLDILTNGVQHLVDLLYSNVDEGLYLTYTHGDNITKGNLFKALVRNVNMSEIIAMIVKFANLDLSDSMKEAWNIDYCSTDFSYIQSLLSIGNSEIGDPISKADVALNSVESFTKMLGLVKLEKVLAEDGLFETTLSVQIKLNENGEPALVSLVLKEEASQEVIVTRLRQIKIENLEFGGNKINITIDVKDFSEGSFDYDTTARHIDFSEISGLVDTIVTTANTKNFTFNGDVSVNLAGLVKLDLALDLFISLDDIQNPYIFAQVILNTNSLADMVFNGSFDKRLITYEYKDGNLTFHRFSRKDNVWQNGLAWKSYNKVVEDSVSRNTYHKSEIMANITPIILDSLGMKETFLGINIPDMIVSIIKNINVNPTLEEALLDFTTDEDCVNTTIKLNGANLLGDGAEDIDLNFGATKYKGYTYDDKGQVIDKTYSCIDSITGLKLKMTGVNIALNLYSKNDVDSYQTTAYTLKSSYSDNSGGICGGRTLYTNKYYRTQYINTVGGLYVA